MLIQKYFRAFKHVWFGKSEFSAIAWVYLIIGPLAVFTNVGLGEWWRIIVIPFVVLVAPLLILLEEKKQKMEETENDVDTL